MSTQEKTEKKPEGDIQAKIGVWNEKHFKLDPRMARKIRFEKQEQLKKKGKGKQEQPKDKVEKTTDDSLPMPKMPAPYPRAKEFDLNIVEIKNLPVEQRAARYQRELVALQNLGQRLVSDKSLGDEAKNPIAADINGAKVRINSEMSSDVNEIKALKISRKKTVTDQLESIKTKMGQVEKIGSDRGEVTQAIGEYNAEKTKLLKSLTQDMTEANFQTADATVKRLALATDRALAVDKLKRERITASQNSVNTLGQNLVPDGNGAFPNGSTRVIDKATDRTVVGHGPLFKPVIKALAEVEKSPIEPQLTVLEKAAKAYLADYNRRDAEGKSSGKAFKPDKITTAKATACRDAIEKVRQLRVRTEIQDDLAKLPKNPRTPDDEKALNRLRAKMIVESGGSKQLGDGESGASESFFLTDSTTGDKAFIFKPSDGEFDAGYGWEKGGGAPREVVLSAVNDVMKNSFGIDCGVSTTTLVSVDNPSVATERNGNNSKRTGAIQNYVPSDPALSKKLDSAKGEYDKDYINQFPPEEIEKVALLDFATLQMDRQASNLLVQPGVNGGSPKLIPIDAGNAMPSRKAFEASRRMFKNNAVLGGAEGKKPFSPEALAKIDQMDPDVITGAMRTANQNMASVDPKAATAVSDETIEMTRRSILFLKKAAKQLTKAEIADAYSYLFQAVLDADNDDVDTAINTAIQAELAKPAEMLAVTQFPNASKLWTDLGWPSGEFSALTQENPTWVLDVLTKATPCPALVKKTNEIIQEVGLQNFEKDPATAPTVKQRYIDVSKVLDDLKNKAVLENPELEKRMKKLGVEYATTNPKGEKKPVTSVTGKMNIANDVNDYFANGGDDELKRRGKSPSKLTFQQKYFESLGGEEKLKQLAAEGLNPYDGDRMEIKISDLKAYREYIALGGDDVYVGLGGPQNKEVMLAARVSMIKDKQMLT